MPAERTTAELLLDVEGRCRIDSFNVNRSAHIDGYAEIGRRTRGGGERLERGPTRF
jgi:hypothetical protein